MNDHGRVRRPGDAIAKTHLRRLAAVVPAMLLAAIAAAAEPSPADANRLGGAASPYLRQHAGNPVHWQPWGDAAFARAAAEDKPVLLSIGYATCHWCHVMARESFEDAEVADWLNAHYVCIKVDREERPDVDQLYQTFVQASTGGGGWPLTVWADAKRVPLAGGTYFPRDQLLANLRRFSTAWAERRAELAGQGDQVAKALAAIAQPAAPGAAPPADAALFSAAVDALVHDYDAVDGGFGAAPKFPQPAALRLLTSLQRRLPARRAELDAMCRATWTAMADGGIHDQLGGGFHRYSVDSAWRVPHFEKMLYDQAQLLDGYLDAWQAGGDARCREVAQDIVAYVLACLVREDGAFAAAEDADSAVGAGPGAEHAEGAFYSWSEEELAAALAGLGDQAEPAAVLIQRTYGADPAGNVPPELDPRGELRGRSVLALAYGRRAGAAPDPAQSALLAAARARLAAARAARPRPARDDQAVAAWNGLMIGALARAGAVLGDPAALAAATRAAAALRASHWRAGTGLSRTGHRPGTDDAAPGTAADYAGLVHGLLALHQAGGGLGWLAWAVELQDQLDRHCWDERRGGYLMADDRVAGLPLRLADDRDGAEPSADALAAANLLRLGDLTDDEGFRARARRLLAAARARLAGEPQGHEAMLLALDESLGEAAHLVVVGDPGAPDTRALLAAAATVPPAALRVLVQDEDATLAALRGRFPALVPMPRRQGRATAYLCLGTRCLPAVDDPAALRARLAADVGR